MPNLLLRIQKRVLRQVDGFIRTTRLLSRWRIDRAVDARDLVGKSITNLQIIVPAQADVPFNVNANDQPFLKVCKYFRDGTYSRPQIFCCEVPDAFCHVATGFICTKDFEAINECQMSYRIALQQELVGNWRYRPFNWFKPFRPQRLPGIHATINNVFYKGWGHWLFDCLPRLYSLQQASAGQRVVLLVPDDLAAAWNDSLDCVLPPNFEILHLTANSWVQVDRMLLASYATAQSNSHMPREFYDYVRNACFTKLGLPLENQPSQRIYVSRAGARHRRIINEEPLLKLLTRYGFTSIKLEELNFRQQVELFHRAEIVIGADGSNWGDMMFAGKIKILILYANAEPNTHWFTAAKGLGQEHYFLAANESSAHANFSVNLADVEQILNVQMGLSPLETD